MWKGTKAALWAVGAIVIIFMIIFVWRTVYFYNQIKKGGSTAVSGAAHFTAGQNKPTANLPAGAKIDLIGLNSPRLGNASAKITIVEFADFTCPFSKQEFPVVRELLAKYPDKINFVYRYFPLGDANHAGGKEAAMAAVCADSQGKFWPFHDKLFQNQKNFTKIDLLSLAGQIGLNMESFSQCFESAAVKSKVEKDWVDGASLGVSGTPSFFLNGEKVEGAIPLEAWEKAIGLVK
ncbi:MAG: DsbA family protein [Candidatus Magasanikbacteria bacterium]|nr:DsbA family protein [Candidatus Magasanikbacteria bacterium]